MVWLNLFFPLSLFMVGVCRPSEPPGSQDSLSSTSSAISYPQALSAAFKFQGLLDMAWNRENVSRASADLSTAQDPFSIPSFIEAHADLLTASFSSHEADPESKSYTVCVRFHAIFSTSQPIVSKLKYERSHEDDQTYGTPEASLVMLKYKFDQLVKIRRVSPELMTSFMQISQFSSYTASSINPVVFRIAALKPYEGDSELKIDITNAFSPASDSSGYVCKIATLSDSYTDGSSFTTDATCYYDSTAKFLKLTGFAAYSTSINKEYYGTAMHYDTDKTYASPFKHETDRTLKSECHMGSSFIFNTDQLLIANNTHEGPLTIPQSQASINAFLSSVKAKFDQLLKIRNVSPAFMVSFIEIPTFTSTTAGIVSSIFFNSAPLQALKARISFFLFIIYINLAKSQCAEGCPDHWINDGYCDRACRNRACNLDGNDCFHSCTCERDNLTNGSCDLECKSYECYYDNGDCLVGCEALGCPITWIKDDYCDQRCYNAVCEYDDGDCENKCESGFFYNANFQCEACSAQCLTCNIKGCTSCPTGYYIDNTVPVSCLPCIDNCDECPNDSSCTACSNGFLLFNDGASCISTSACQANNGFFVENEISCKPCIDNCKVCSDGITCSECLATYYLTTGGLGCEECIDNCDECSDSSSCTACSNGFLLFNDGASCIATSDCRTDDGFFTNQAGTECYTCIENCSRCNQIGVCNQCISTHSLSENRTNCVLECPRGFYSDTSGVKTCVEYFDGCEVCDSSRCIECESGRA